MELLIVVWCWHVCEGFDFLWVWLYSSQYHLSKERDGGAPKMTFCLCLILSWPLLYLCSTLCTTASWSTPLSSYPITKMSSAMPKMFGISLNISSILHWNMLPTSAAPNGSHLYLYLPNGHANVVRYDDFSSNFRLWYPELVCVIYIYFTLLSLGKISFNVGPLCTGLINTWFNLTGSKHSLTLPFALGTNTKLLHHSAVLSTLVV